MCQCVCLVCASRRTLAHIFYYKWFSFGVFIFTIIRIVKWTIAAVDLCYKYKIYGLFNLDKFLACLSSLRAVCTRKHHCRRVSPKPVVLLLAMCVVLGRVSALKYIRIVEELIGFNGAHTTYNGTPPTNTHFDGADTVVWNRLRQNQTIIIIKNQIKTRSECEKRPNDKLSWNRLLHESVNILLITSAVSRKK